MSSLYVILKNENYSLHTVNRDENLIVPGETLKPSDAFTNLKQVIDVLYPDLPQLERIALASHYEKLDEEDIFRKHVLNPIKETTILKESYLNHLRTFLIRLGFDSTLPHYETVGSGSETTHYMIESNGGLSITPLNKYIEFKTAKLKQTEGGITLSLITEKIGSPINQRQYSIETIQRFVEGIILGNEINFKDELMTYFTLSVGAFYVTEDNMILAQYKDSKGIKQFTIPKRELTYEEIAGIRKLDLKEAALTLLGEQMIVASRHTNNVLIMVPEKEKPSLDSLALSTAKAVNSFTGNHLACIPIFEEAYAVLLDGPDKLGFKSSNKGYLAFRFGSHIEVTFLQAIKLMKHSSEIYPINLADADFDKRKSGKAYVLDGSAQVGLGYEVRASQGFFARYKNGLYPLSIRSNPVFDPDIPLVRAMSSIGMSKGYYKDMWNLISRNPGLAKI